MLDKSFVVTMVKDDFTVSGSSTCTLPPTVSLEVFSCYRSGFAAKYTKKAYSSIHFLSIIDINNIDFNPRFFDNHVPY